MYSYMYSDLLLYMRDGIKSDNKSMTINFQKLHFPNVVQFSGNFIEMVSAPRYTHHIGWDGMRPIWNETPKFFDRTYVCVSLDTHTHTNTHINWLNGENGLSWMNFRAYFR